MNYSSLFEALRGPVSDDQENKSYGVELVRFS